MITKFDCMLCYCFKHHFALINYHSICFCYLLSMLALYSAPDVIQLGQSLDSVNELFLSDHS